MYTSDTLSNNSSEVGTGIGQIVITHYNINLLHLRIEYNDNNKNYILFGVISFVVPIVTSLGVLTLYEGLRTHT